MPSLEPEREQALAAEMAAAAAAALEAAVAGGLPDCSGPVAGAAGRDAEAAGVVLKGGADGPQAAAAAGNGTAAAAAAAPDAQRLASSLPCR